MTKENCKAKCSDSKGVGAEGNVVEETQNCENNNESQEEVQDDADIVSEMDGFKDDKSAEVADEAAIWKDKYIRLSAEFDNYRKRTLREKMDLISTGGENVIKTMLPVLDDMDRAFEAIKKTEDINAVIEGLLLISMKLNDCLKSNGLVEIEALGLPLDTDLHEAIAKFPKGEEEKGLIFDVAQKGYKLHDKVIRHSKVVIGE